MNRQESLVTRLGELRVFVLATSRRHNLAEKLADEGCELTDLGILSAYFEDEAARRGPHAPDWRGMFVELLQKPNAAWRDVVATLELNPSAGGKAEASYRGDGGTFSGGGGGNTCVHGQAATEHCDSCDPLADPAVQLLEMREAIAERRAKLPDFVDPAPNARPPGQPTKSGMSFGRYAQECADAHPDRCRSGVYEGTTCVSKEEWERIQAEAGGESVATAPKGDGWAELTEGVR